MKNVNGKTLLENLEKVLKVKADKSASNIIGINTDSVEPNVAGFINGKMVFVGGMELSNMVYVSYDDAKTIAKFLKTMKGMNGFEVDVYDDGKLYIENAITKNKIEIVHSEYGVENNLKEAIELWDSTELCGKISPDELKAFCSLSKFTNKKATKEILKYIYGDGNTFYGTDSYRARRFETKNEIKDLFVHYSVADVLAKGKQEVVFSVVHSKNSKWYFAQQGNMDIAYQIDDKLTYPNLELLYRGYNETKKQATITNGKAFNQDLQVVKQVSTKVDNKIIIRIDWRNGVMQDYNGMLSSKMESYYKNDNNSLDFDCGFSIAMLNNTFDVYNKATIYMAESRKPMFIDYMNGMVDIYLPVRLYE